MVKDHGRAEDVTQEVFVSALRRMRETEQPLAFKPWLYQIAKNGCIDAFRRSKRAEEVSYDADDALAPADHSKLVGAGPSPDAAVAAKQDLDNLCGAFGGLSETHHEILVLRELEGLSYQEIGKRMGMSRPGGRVDPVPRAPPPDRGVRRHRLRRPLPADHADHRRRGEHAAGRARHAPPRPPPLALPVLPPRGARRRAGPRPVHAPERARAGRDPRRGPPALPGAGQVPPRGRSRRRRDRRAAAGPLERAPADALRPALERLGQGRRRRGGARRRRGRRGGRAPRRHGAGDVHRPARARAPGQGRVGHRGRRRPPRPSRSPPRRATPAARTARRRPRRPSTRTPRAARV